MIGGLQKTTSRFAIAAAAGFIAGGLALTPAQAADFGGDCCADLEERIAELEATTARKGTRVVSLTINGWVNKGVMFWDDGHESNAYVVDHTASESRIRFSGEARIDPDWSAGFVYEFEFGDKRTIAATQVWGDMPGTGRYNTRHAYWWVRSDRLGQLSVGHQSQATDGVLSVNLGNSPVSSNALHHHSQSFQIWSGSMGMYSGLTWRNFFAGFGGGNAHGNRGSVVRYDSPSLHGFVISTSWGEDDAWDVALRYAQEWNSIRVAAAIGYQQTTDAWNGCGDYQQMGNFPAGTKPGTISDCELWAMSGSVMHTPTGLYVSGGYGESKDKNRDAASRNVNWQHGINSTDETWWIQAGIQRTWHPLGSTTFYGEYSTVKKGSQDPLVTGYPGAAGATALMTRVGEANGMIDSSRVEMWGLGVNQNIDAAAMNVYAFYRNYSASVSLLDVDGDHVASPSLSDLDVFMAGARVRF